MNKLSSFLEDYDVIDLSHRFEHGMPRPQVPYGHIPWKNESLGDGFNTFMILVFEHAGTHVDAPVHLAGIKGLTIDKVPLERWMGPISCLDFSAKGSKEYVTLEEIKLWEKNYGVINKNEIVLLNMGWQKNWCVPSGVENQPYLHGNPGLSEEGATYLADKKVKLVGGDIPTIDSDADLEERAHKALLPRGILILENACNLDKIPPKGAYFIGLPLKIGEGTGSPVRAIALVPKQ